MVILLLVFCSRGDRMRYGGWTRVACGRDEVPSIKGILSLVS